MCSIPSPARSNSYGETSWDSGDSNITTPRKNYNQELIDQANTVPLPFIFKHYGVHIDSSIRKDICPFKSHKGGRESSPSFYYYPETNSFFCFGCKVGGKFAHGVEFISLFEEISRSKAAEKVINLFSQDVDLDNVNDEQNFSERLEMMLDFSEAVKLFRETYLDLDSANYIENIICKTFDRMNDKFTLENDALKKVIENLKIQMKNYKRK